MSEKSSVVIEAARNQMGSPYVFGAWGGLCTPSLRRKYAGLNPSHADNIAKKCHVLNGSAGSCVGCKWEGCLAFDCRGFTHWCLLQAGITITGGGATSQWNSSGNWAARGAVSSMPDVVCCVFKQDTSTGKMAHTGLHIGGGDIIHCSSGVQIGRVTDKGWTHWAVPIGLYTDEELEVAGLMVTRQTVKRGSTGAAVTALQEMLVELGYDTGGVDGIYGAKTEAAVRSVQAAAGLSVDGICGVGTWGALTAAVDKAAASADAQPAPDGATEQEKNDSAAAFDVRAWISRMRSMLNELEEGLE